MQPSQLTQELYGNSINTYSSYIDSLTLPIEIKSILRSDGINHASYYLFYPQLFKEAFYIKDSEKVNLLSIAGFLFYKSLIYVDKIVDNQTSDEIKGQYFQLSLVCQEESIKILASLFPIENEFWKHWNNRKLEYISAQKAEKKDYSELDSETFFNIADNKSAFGKVAIDSLALLSNQMELSKAYQALLKSHRYFSIGRQLYDDVSDVKEDFVNKQANYAIYKLRHICEEKGINFQKLDAVYLEKYLYVLGVSEEILYEAINHFDQAISIVESFVGSSSIWIETIKAYSEITKRLIVKQSAYIKQIKSQVELSNKKIETQRDFSKRTIEDRITQGLEFVNKKLLEDGNWEEYINSAGASNTWATSFISSFLYEVVDSRKIINFDKIKSFLLSKYEKEFSYNDFAPRDGDSTTFGLLALYQMGVDIKSKLPTWIKYQHINGGFSTYIAEDRGDLKELMGSYKESDFGMWENPQICVSAVALYLMQLLKHNYNLEEKVNSLKYFILNAHKNSIWDSYWWTSPFYSTSFIIKASFMNNDKDLQSPCINAIKNILQLQSRSGAFGDSFIPESSFYTGLVIDSLCCSDTIITRNLPAIEKSITWIINNQYRDGSWLESHAMRLPSFRTVTQNVTKLWPVSRTGLNVRAVEFNRLFSTAVCISALNSYAQRRF